MTLTNLTNFLLKAAMAYAFALLYAGNTPTQAADNPAQPDEVTAAILGR